MSDEQDKHKLKTEQAEDVAARAQQNYDEAQPGSFKDSCLKVLLAKDKALEQLREQDLLQQRAAAGVTSATGYYGIYRT